MQVKELIEKLGGCHPEAEVHLNGGCSPVKATMVRKHDMYRVAIDYEGDGVLINEEIIPRQDLEAELRGSGTVVSATLTDRHVFIS